MKQWWRRFLRRFFPGHPQVPEKVAYHWLALYQREKLRMEVRGYFAESRQAVVQRDMEKILLVRGANLAREQSGWITIEVPELVRWIAQANQGVEKVLEQAVAGLAVSKLAEVLA